tara:strand:+ start:5081 stop:5341 length:261 start_codon:yes stop_codon:yes gene_type:complete
MRSIDHSESNQIIADYLGDNIYSKEVYYANLDRAYDSMKNQWNPRYMYSIHNGNNKKISIKVYRKRYNEVSKEYYGDELLGYLGDY